MNSAFVNIEVIAFTPAQQNPQTGEVAKPASHNQFTMRVRPRYVAAVNPVSEAPVEGVKSIVYFSAESGMKPILSVESSGQIDKKVSDMLLYSLPKQAI